MSATVLRSFAACLAMVSFSARGTRIDKRASRARGPFWFMHSNVTHHDTYCKTFLQYAA